MGHSVGGKSRRNRGMGRLRHCLVIPCLFVSGLLAVFTVSALGAQDPKMHNSENVGTKYGTWGTNWDCYTCHVTRTTPTERASPLPSTVSTTSRRRTPRRPAPLVPCSRTRWRPSIPPSSTLRRRTSSTTATEPSRSSTTTASRGSSMASWTRTGRPSPWPRGTTAAFRTP